MKNIIIFASGSGSNAENIIRWFAKSGTAKVAAVFCNNAKAGVLEKASVLNVPAVVFTKEELNTTGILQKLRAFKPDLIVLAGFLLKFPDYIIAAYPDKIINIHPALLPKYGGKGMYGMNVHNAILENKETETGISIHYVNEHYDKGGMIFQKKVSVSDCITAEEIAAKIHELEKEHFPAQIEKLLK